MAQRRVADALSTDRRVYFQLLRDGFARAAEAAGVEERSYRIGGHRVRLRFAGEALISAIDPAIAHLRIPDDGREPDLGIELFDSVSTETALPFLLEQLVAVLRWKWYELLDQRREIRGLHGDGLRTVFHLGPDILSALASDTARAVYWIEDAADVPYYEKGYPLSNLLNWWLADRGLLFVHAAAVAFGEGVALLPGSGGSGKSTTTLACLRQGGILGDDYCLVPARPQGPETPCFSLYNTIKLKSEQDVDRFEHLRQRFSNLERIGDGPDQEKAMLFLHEHFPDTVRTEGRLRAILVPRITGAVETFVAPLSRGEALRALAPSTVFQLAGDSRHAFSALAGLARAIPCFELRLGTALDGIAPAIRSAVAAPRERP